jgi:hypothetical protein
MRTRLALAAAALLTAALAVAQDPPVKRGFPTPAEAQKARDDADYQRAVTAYRFWYPTVSVEGIFHGNREQGLRDNEAMPILAARPHHVGFTLNSDTPYGGGAIDVKGGPYVIEVPPGPFIGLANDHHQGWILDVGLPGPDQGKGASTLSSLQGTKARSQRGISWGSRRRTRCSSRCGPCR